MPPNTTASIAITANPSALPAGLRQAAAMMIGFGKTVGAALSNTHLGPKQNNKANWVAKVAAGAAIATYATRGVDMILAQGKAIFDFNDKLVRFGIAARMTPQQMNGIAVAARKTAGEVGIGAEDVLDAGKAYMDLAGAENFTIGKMNLLARAAQASGSKTTDLAGMMYQLTRSMKVTDAQMEDTMGGLINQAKDGGIEAKEMAAEFAGLLPLFARFKGATGREGAIQAGAAFQITRDSFNSASEAGTGLQRVFAGLRTYGSRFEKHGVKIWNVDKDGFKTARSWSEIVRDISKSDLIKDPELMKKAFGRTEGWRTMELLLENLDRLAKLEASGRVDGVIKADNITYATSAAGRLSIAMEKTKNAVAAAFTPERIEKFVGAIEGLTEKVGPLVEAVGKIGDGLGAIYSAGKKIRGFIGGGVAGSILRETSSDEIDAVAREQGISKPEAARRLQADYGRSRQLRMAVEAGLKDDKTTPATDRLAVAAFMRPYAPGLTDEHSSAEQYIKEAGLTPERIAEIAGQIAKDNVDASIRQGTNKSVDPAYQFTKAMNDLAPAIGRSVANAMQNVPGPVLTLDANPVSRAVKNAPDRRRRL